VQGAVAASAATTAFLGAGVGSRTSLVRAQARSKANSKLQVAFIGTTHQAGADYERIMASGRVQPVAFVDVDDNFLDEALNRPANADAKRFNDYREMFDKAEKEFDAVLVAIPDHHHFHASMLALRHGKHVYCEKPLCHDVWECRQLNEVSHEKKLVTQMGTQIHGTENYRQVVEKIQAGAIGNVRRVHVWVGGTYVAEPQPNPQPEVPKGLHWDLWIGPSPEHAYHPKLHPFWWRGWLEYGGGKMADMACHHMDLPTWALGLTAPTSVESHAPDPDTKDASGPAWQIVDFMYPAVGGRGPVHLTWYHGEKRPEQFKDPNFPKWGDGCLFEGDKGLMLAGYDAHKLLPETDFKDYQSPPATIPRTIGHYNEWVQACLYTDPVAPACRFAYSAPLAEAVQLGVVSHRVGNKKLEWDAKALKVTNVAEANRFLKREYRKGWEI
jgi:predicted dehydrogenase